MNENEFLGFRVEEDLLAGDHRVSETLIEETVTTETEWESTLITKAQYFRIIALEQTMVLAGAISTPEGAMSVAQIFEICEEFVDYLKNGGQDGQG